MAPPRSVPSPAGGCDRDFQQGSPVSRTSAEADPCQPSRAGVPAPRPGAAVWN